ncbi:MAG TPA: 3-isopropylmalate dehydrogenase [Saprospiraceae bacterium]|nr:3-isopropylmalate dehydrogenase [Saprospiraceae bacterium]
MNQKKLNKITVLPGDGIGPEVVTQALKVLKAIAKKYGHQWEIKEALIGACAIDTTGDPFPEASLNACQEADAILLGAIGDPKYDNDPSAKVRPEQGLLRMRKSLGLYANIRPVRIYEQLVHLSVFKPEILKNVDFVIYRELTGGIYFGEKVKEETYSSDLCLYHRYEVERISHLAFQQALTRRKKLTLVDKANVLETSRLWRSVVQEISTQYPEVALDFLFIDNAAMQVILNPSRFDVVLCDNLFGDILSDEASVLSGSMGLLPSASKGETSALYEPIHGSYPQAAGKDIANPLATILSVEMMLRDFGYIHEADDIIKAVDSCIAEGYLTEDLRPAVAVGCAAVGDKVANSIV